MARRAKRRPFRASKLVSAPPSDGIDILPYDPSSDQAMASSHKRRCHTARQKNALQLQESTPTSTPTLGDRFHALPPELRRLLFSHLLVQPVKWQLAHTLTPEPCPKTLYNCNCNPSIYSEPQNTCIRCMTHHDHTRVPLWRHLQDPDPDVPDWHKMSGGKSHVVWKNPWRSEWAPEVANPFICSECWDKEFRARPNPAQKEVGERHLRCLCARRANLGVMLVCRRWYAEAGAVFYARNTFAFESAAVFKGFMNCLPQRWRKKVTRVSIMAYHPSEPEGPVEEASGWEGNRKLAGVWPLLHKLPNLSYLELDAHFLARAKIAQRLLKLSLRNVRRVCFVQHNVWPLQRVKQSEWIWPEYHSSRLIVGGFAEEVARAIKGQRPRCGFRKHQGVMLAAGREEAKETHIFGLKDSDVGTGNVYFAASSTAYSRFWWDEQKNCAGGSKAHFTRGGNGLHAYIGTEYTHFGGVRAAAKQMRNEDEDEEVHWRDWHPTSYHDDDFGIRNLSLWRVKAGWDFLFPIQAEEFLDDRAKEARGWEFLCGIEA